MPTWNKIKEFWSNTSLFQLKGVKDINKNFCFACLADYGEMKLERAHIHALCTGGSNEISNLHLLCSVCHKDSEFLGGSSGGYEKLYVDKTQELYWKWFFDRDFAKSSFSSWVKGGYALNNVVNMSNKELKSLIDNLNETYKYNPLLMAVLKPHIDEIEQFLLDQKLLEICKKKGVNLVIV